MTTSEAVALTVHGWRGVLDLTVPTSATVAEVATTYAGRAGLDRVPALVDRSGQQLPPTVTVEVAGLRAGAVLVALGDPPATVPTRPGAAEPEVAGAPAAAGWCWVAVLLALVAAAATAQLPAGADRAAPAALLALAGLVGCLPFGGRAAERALVAPVFAAAAGAAWWWTADAERWPAVAAVAGLSAAVAAGLARAWAGRTDEALRVWLVAGVVVLLVTGGAVVASRPPQVAWAILVVAAVLAVRWVPAVALTVPDRHLLDLERLAVTAWTAHESTPAPAPSTGIGRAEVAGVAARAHRTITAAAVAIATIAAAGSALLLGAARVPLDRIGAQVVVGAAGCALVLAARSHRSVAAGQSLRVGGVACLVALTVDVLATATAQTRAMVAVGTVLLALVLLLVGVVVGRGRRSERWSLYADLAETTAGAVAIGAAVVAIGLFRYLWTTTG